MKLRIRTYFYPPYSPCGHLYLLLQIPRRPGPCSGVVPFSIGTIIILYPGLLILGIILEIDLTYSCSPVPVISSLTTRK